MGEMQVCQDCCQIVRVTEDGSTEAHSSGPYGERTCASSGLLTGRVAAIVASSAQRAHPIRPGFLRKSLLPMRAATSGEAPQLRPSSSTPMPAPKWVPEWNGENLPSVILPSSGWIGAWVPGYSKPMQAYRVQDLTRRNVTSSWSARLECWTVNNRHFQTVADTLMQHYRMILVGREYNPNEKCNVRCRDAEGPLCTCSCRAKNHGRGRWMDGWTVTGEFDSVIDGSPWHWMVARRA